MDMGLFAEQTKNLCAQ